VVVGAIPRFKSSKPKSLTSKGKKGEALERGSQEKGRKEEEFAQTTEEIMGGDDDGEKEWLLPPNHHQLPRSPDREVGRKTWAEEERRDLAGSRKVHRPERLEADTGLYHPGLEGGACARRREKKS